MDKGEFEMSIVKAAQDALILVIDGLENSGINSPGARLGGYLRVFLATDETAGLLGWQEIVASEIGGLNPGKVSWDGYKIVSFEKATRLMMKHADTKLRHMSSWQSRDHSGQKYGGAIIVEVVSSGGEKSVLLISFSGLPEEADEVMGLLIAEKMEWQVTHDSIRELLRWSNNRLAEKVLMLAV